MQNRSFNEHYYKIESATFSVLLRVGRKPVLGISSNIMHKNVGVWPMKIPLDLVFL